MAGFHPVAQQAAHRLLDAIEEEDLVVGILRYVRAVDVEERVREEWYERGCPTLETFTNGMIGAHPLMALVMKTARHAQDMYRAAGLGINGAAWRRPTGRPVGAVSAPDRKMAPPRLTPIRGSENLLPKLSVVEYPEKGA